MPIEMDHVERTLGRPCVPKSFCEVRKVRGAQDAYLECRVIAQQIEKLGSDRAVGNVILTFGSTDDEKYAAGLLEFGPFGRDAASRVTPNKRSNGKSQRRVRIRVLNYFPWDAAC